MGYYAGITYWSSTLRKKWALNPSRQIWSRSHISLQLAVTQDKPELVQNKPELGVRTKKQCDPKPGKPNLAWQRPAL